MDRLIFNEQNLSSRRLITSVIDQIAEEEPETAWIVAPASDVSHNLNYRQFANAINGVSWWLEREIGRGNGFTSLVFFGTGGGDVRYPILLLGAVKAGYYTLFNSPRNSIDAHINLFKLQNSKIMVLPDPHPPYVAPLLEAYPMQILQFPDLEHLLNTETTPYPYTKTFEEAYNDPLLSLHTSGTTGLPKPRTYTMATITHMANNYYRPSPIDGIKTISQLFQQDLVLSAVPFFHAAGIIYNLACAIFGRQKIALLPPGPPLNAEAAVALMKTVRATAAFLAPSTLDDIGKQPHLLDALSDVNCVMAGGGAISKASGDAIITRTRFLNILGTTEIGTLAELEVAPEDWAYVRSSPLAGAEFRDSSDGDYELLIVRDEKLKGYQPTFDIFPDLQEYSTHDLFRKHPTKPDHWLYTGRSDDVIVFLNGEKTNPTTMEPLVQSHPEVRAALVVGQGRFEAALLVETISPPSLTTKEKATLIETLWPTIQEANQQSPAHARISKSHILFTSPGKPILRTAKGTVQRKITLQSYSKELDALYADADSMSDLEVPVVIDTNDMEDSILWMLRTTTGISDLATEDDLFSRGMDSLQVIQTARSLKAGLAKAGVDAKALAPSTIYTNPTVLKLAAAVKSYMEEGPRDAESLDQARLQKMKQMLEKYSAGLPDRPPRVKEDLGYHDSRQSVVLTGSTGALGSYLLDALISCESVSTIYCLNRSADAEQRQAKGNASRGLTSEWDSHQVKCLTSDYSLPDLGLGQEMYSDIAANASLILHNAWQVDFNISLDSYESHVRGVRHLLDLCLNSAHQAKIFFLSSIASVMNWSANHSGPIPEEVFSDYTVAQRMGYGESKHITERLLALASEKSQIRASFCRMGQIAGPIHGTKGMWNKQEWLPSLVLSSQHLGLVPDSLGTIDKIDWIPIDVLAAIVLELALERNANRRVYHTVNPKFTTWEALLPSVQAELGPDVKTVTLAAWVKALTASSSASTTQKELAANPAVKLLDFYGSLLGTKNTAPRLETQKTEQASPMLAGLGPVKGEWMVKWMKQWRQN